jgi:CheY-like chemotaxis protein
VGDGVGERIVVVEDDADARDLLVRRLWSQGYKVAEAEDTTEALEKIDRDDPDLVLLDVMLPGESGFDFLKRLREKPERRLLPVVIVSALGQIDAKAEGFQAGADDYIAKPYDFQELLVRVRAGIDRGKRMRAAAGKESPLSPLHLAVLRSLVESGGVDPIPNPRAPRGYRYGLAGLEDGGGVSEHDILASLEALSCVSGGVVDVVRLCPDCESPLLNCREACPSCSSVRIDITDLIHHFRCANVGPEKAFSSGKKLVCPKCREELRHIGVDYERPSETFSCPDCGDAFTEPAVEVLCFSCHAKHPVERCVIVQVKRYEATAQGRIAVKTGTLHPVTGDGAPNGDESGLSVIPRSLFADVLDAEIAKAREGDWKLTLVGVLARPVDDRAANDADRLRATRRLAAVLVDWSKPDGLVGRVEGGALVAILPGTDPAEGESIRRDLAATIRKGYVRGVPISLRVVAAGDLGGEGAATAESLLASVGEALEKATETVLSRNPDANR